MRPKVAGGNRRMSRRFFLLAQVIASLLVCALIVLFLVWRVGMDLRPALLIGVIPGPLLLWDAKRAVGKVAPEPGEPWTYPWTGVPRIRVWKFVAIGTVFAAILILSEPYLLAAILEPIALVAAFVIHRHNRSSKNNSKTSPHPNAENP